MKRKCPFCKCNMEYWEYNNDFYLHRYECPQCHLVLLFNEAPKLEWLKKPEYIES